MKEDAVWSDLSTQGLLGTTGLQKQADSTRVFESDDNLFFGKTFDDSGD